MPDLRPLRRLAPLASAGAGVGLAFAAGLLPQVSLLALAFTMGYVFTIPDRAGRRLSLSPMVGVAALLLTDGSLQVILPAAAVGMPLGWWYMGTTRGPRGLDHVFPSDAMALVAAAAIYSGLNSMITERLLPQQVELAQALAVGLAALAWYVTAALTRPLRSGLRRRLGLRRIWWQAFLDGPAYLALVAGGAMLGLAWEAMSWWAIPLALVPYGFSHLSLTRLAETRHTYRQTIRALGRIPEAGGLVGQGRAERTAELAGALAGQIRLPQSEVERVEYAGLLHDVGRVVFNDPKVAAGGYTDADVAAWGAAIIQESPFLRTVGTIVADQHEPYRRRGEARNSQLPRAAQVVRVAGTYDRAVHEHGKTPVEALEELHRGAAYEFDPEVVGALRRVLRQRGVPGA